MCWCCVDYHGWCGCQTGDANLCWPLVGTPGFHGTITLSCMWSGVVQPRWRRRKTLSGTCLNVGAYSTHALFLIFTGKYRIKKKYVSFFQCQLSLTRFSVSFVHRHLKVEIFSAEYTEGVCGVGFVWFLSIHFLYWWFIGLKIAYRWISYGAVSSLCH